MDNANIIAVGVLLLVMVLASYLLGYADGKRTGIWEERAEHNAMIARVRDEEAEWHRQMVPIIRDVLAEAIEAGGSSLRDYRQAEGELGYFQHSFQVYGREGEPCVTEGCKGMIARIVQSGRSSFYCPQCQR